MSILCDLAGNRKNLTEAERRAFLVAAYHGPQEVRICYPLRFRRQS